MNKNKSSKKKGQPSKSRLLCMLLYPTDNEAHKKALASLYKYYQVLTVCHDKDTYLYDESDEDGNIIHSAGELKKPHYHVLVQFRNPRYISGVAKELDIEEHLIQKCNSFDSYVIYMTHRDEPLKYQYELKDLKGTLIDRALRVLEVPETNEEKFFNIQNWIISHPNAQYKDLGDWCTSYGYFSFFMRYQSYFKEVFYERKCSNKYDYIERSKKS